MNSKNQIKGIRKSCKLAAKCLEYVKDYIKEGITTEELDQILTDFIYKNGATSACLGYKGFPKGTCISVNEVVCHGIPNKYQLKAGDILNIDITTILDGYYGDTSRMFIVDETSQENKKLIEVTYEALEIGIKQVKPKNYFSNIGYYINEYVEKEGFHICPYYLGHQVGLEFHNSPYICHKSLVKGVGEIMRKNMVFTIEPIVCFGSGEVVIDEDGWTARTVDGFWSAQAEDQILVTDKGFEILTRL